MSNIVKIQDEGELHDLLNSEHEVVLKFTAPAWCRPCQQFAPHYEAASEKATETTFVAVDVDNAPWAMQSYGVRGVPTVMLYRDGEYIKNLQERTVVKLLSEIN